MRVFGYTALACLTVFMVSAAQNHNALAIGEQQAKPVNDMVITGSGLPKKLSDFRFFKDAAGEKPNSRVQLYKLNTPLFTDYAEKRRYIYVPSGKHITPAPQDADALMQFPVGSALIKSFGYQQKGKLRLLETRVLLHRADGWLALPYVWNEDQSEAILKVAGKRMAVSFTDPSGDERQISYSVPNKNQCKECHSLSKSVMPIGPKARNLDDGMQLQKWAQLGFIKQVPAITRPLPTWNDAKSAAVAQRARAYLDVNCSHCHNPKGSASNSGLFLSYDESLPVNYGVYKRPVAAGRGSGGYIFAIQPGAPEQSIMMHRIQSLDPGVAMPELGRSIVHKEGVELLRTWIANMEDAS